MMMPGRKYEPVNVYRYGFNGMEKDNEMKGDGNSYTTEFREYDPRISRWLSVDPLTKLNSYQSTYVAYDNNPIFYIDPAGADSEDPKEKVNIYVITKNRKKQDGSDDEPLNSSLKSARKANVIIFEVDNVKDFVKQLSDWRKNNSDKEIGNLIFDSHGAYWEPRFRIGSEIINGKTVGLLKDVKPLLDANTTITLLACHAGGGLNDEGVKFTQKVSNSLGKTVLANKSWSPSGHIFRNSNYCGIIGAKYQTPDDISNKDEKDSPGAVANIGFWITANPSNGGKLNIVQHNAIYLDKDGDYHLSSKNFNFLYWGFTRYGYFADYEKKRNEFIQKNQLTFVKIN